MPTTAPFFNPLAWVSLIGSAEVEAVWDALQIELLLVESCSRVEDELLFPLSSSPSSLLKADE